MSNHLPRCLTVILGVLLLSAFEACAAPPRPIPSVSRTPPTTTRVTPTPEILGPVSPTAIAEATPTPTPTATNPVEPTEDIRPEEVDEHPLVDVDPRGQTVTFWHTWGTGNAGKTITRIIDDFNATNEWGIRVAAEYKGNYSDLEYALDGALPSGDLPNLAIAYNNVLANWWTRDIIADLNPFFDHPEFGLSAEEETDFYRAALDSSNFEEVRVGLPFSQSGNVIFYNTTWARELGFMDPPTTPAEFKIQACAAASANNQDEDTSNDGTGGFVIYSSATNILSWIYASGGQVSGVPDSSFTLNTPTSNKVASFLKDLWDSGCTYQTKTYANPEFATRRALFTTSSTVGCQFQEGAFEKDGAYQDEWTVLAFPGTEQGKAIIIFPQLIGMVDTTPEQNLAAWIFMKYLTSPQIQAKWATSSQYYPVRISGTDLIGDFRRENPQWAAGLELLAYGRAEPSHPSWGTIRMYVQSTFDEVLESPKDQISVLLEDLDDVAAEVVAEFDD
jgi:ABC-type glycerol-3-phosphate transport system substrate-binding protein